MATDYLDKNLTFFGSQIPVPDTDNVASTNAVSGSSSLGQNAQECAAQHGQYPTYMLVDFVSLCLSLGPTDRAIPTILL
jgi:hypothetical protein